MKQRFKAIPSLAAVMTPFPYAIRSREPLSRAQQLMRQHGIRHLPVTRDGRLIGVISDRDIRVAQAAGAGAANQAPESEPEEAIAGTSDAEIPRPPGDPPAGQVCSAAFAIPSSTRLDQVCEAMAAGRFHCAIALRGEKVVGILTVTDICRLLADATREIFPDPEGDEVA